LNLVSLGYGWRARVLVMEDVKEGKALEEGRKDSIE
jgi:hypothetical protein